MLKISEDEQEVFWDKIVDLGVMGKLRDISIDLHGCDTAGVTEDMAEEEKLSKISKYYGERFKELEADVKYVEDYCFVPLMELYMKITN